MLTETATNKPAARFARIDRIDSPCPMSGKTVEIVDQDGDAYLVKSEDGRTAWVNGYRVHPF